jgi:hypothetical protein
MVCICTRCQEVKLESDFRPPARQCKQCLAQVARDWYARNRERALARMSAAYEERVGRKRQPRQQIAGQLNCVTCHTWKPMEQFNRLKSARFGLDRKCRDCNKAMCRDYYYTHRRKKDD